MNPFNTKIRESTCQSEAKMKEELSKGRNQRVTLFAGKTKIKIRLPRSDTFLLDGRK